MKDFHETLPILRIETTKQQSMDFILDDSTLKIDDRLFTNFCRIWRSIDAFVT